MFLIQAISLFLFPFLGFSGIKLPPVTLALALAELARLSPLFPLLLAGVLADAAQAAVAAHIAFALLEAGEAPLLQSFGEPALAAYVLAAIFRPVLPTISEMLDRIPFRLGDHTAVIEKRLHVVLPG